MAVLPGKTVEYAGGEAGKVVFGGDIHGPKAGLKCASLLSSETIRHEEG